jgi:hypothetical protein
MPQTPYIHSPEEGTEEAEQQLWRVHITIDAARRKRLKEAIDEARRSQIPTGKPHTPGSHTRTTGRKEQQ